MITKQRSGMSSPWRKSGMMHWIIIETTPSKTLTKGSKTPAWQIAIDNERNVGLIRATKRGVAETNASRENSVAQTVQKGPAGARRCAGHGVSHCRRRRLEF